MRITENKLRSIIRQVIKESYADRDLSRLSYDRAFLAVVDELGIRVQRALGGETERRGPLYTVTPVMGGQKMALSRPQAFNFIMQLLSNSFEKEILGSYKAEDVAHYLISTARP